MFSDCFFGGAWFGDVWVLAESSLLVQRVSKKGKGPSESWKDEQLLENQERGFLLFCFGGSKPSVVFRRSLAEIE